MSQDPDDIRRPLGKRAHERIAEAARKAHEAAGDLAKPIVPQASFPTESEHQGLHRAIGKARGQ